VSNVSLILIKSIGHVSKVKLKKTIDLKGNSINRIKKSNAFGYHTSIDGKKLPAQIQTNV